MWECAHDRTLQIFLMQLFLSGTDDSTLSHPATSSNWCHFFTRGASALPKIAPPTPIVRPSFRPSLCGTDCGGRVLPEPSAACLHPAASIQPTGGTDPCPPPPSTEPSISQSEHATLPLDEALTLQCNLTSAHSTHDESFWMKNGEEIPETRSKNKNTEYKCVCTPRVCSSECECACGGERVHVRSVFSLSLSLCALQHEKAQRRRRRRLHVRLHLRRQPPRQRNHRSQM